MYLVADVIDGSSVYCNYDTEIDSWGQAMIETGADADTDEEVFNDIVEYLRDHITGLHMEEDAPENGKEVYSIIDYLMDGIE